MHGGEARQADERLLPLPLRSDRAAPAELVGEHDRVDEALKEVPLGAVTDTPGLLERLVRGK